MNSKTIGLLISICLAVLMGVVLVAVVFFNTMNAYDSVATVRDNSIVEGQSHPEETFLDVPLLYQFEEPSLYNGCEVTSLAMIMNYSGYDISKNQLAEVIKKVPFVDEDGYYGNLNIGFVGDIEGNDPGLGVYAKLIEDILVKYVNQNKVKNITGESFQKIEEAIALGFPVWVITTIDFMPVSDLEVWDTREGLVEITYSMHSVVVTGYDQDSIYLNDPYGEKDYKTDKEDFVKVWEQMGSQGIYIEI